MISNNIIYNTFFHRGFPKGPTEDVFFHLDPEGLKRVYSLGATPVSAELGYVWKKIAKSLEYPAFMIATEIPQ